MRTNQLPRIPCSLRVFEILYLILMARVFIAFLITVKPNEYLRILYLKIFIVAQ